MDNVVHFWQYFELSIYISTYIKNMQFMLTIHIEV